MPRKSQFRRVRRLRFTGRAGLMAIGLGLSTVSSAAPEAVHHRPGGWPGVAVGLLLVAVGVVAVVRVVIKGGQAASRDWQELRARGVDDGLPMGAFRQDQRIGLEAADMWLLLGTLAAAVGLFFVIWGAIDPHVGWKVDLAFSLVGFIPAAVCFRAGTGIKYWVTSDGIETGRWPRRSVRWTDVERLVPLWRGSPVGGTQPVGALELQTVTPIPGDSIGALRRWWGRDFVLNVALVEIDSRDLLSTMRAVAFANDPLAWRALVNGGRNLTPVKGPSSLPMSDT